MTSSNFHRLLKRALQGDKEAFGDFYEQMLERVYRYVFYRTGHVQDAEDLTETVFLKAWEALHRTGLVPDDPEAWIYRIAHNLVIDFYRTRKTSIPLNEAPLPVQESIAETEVLLKEDMERLVNALKQLPPTYQQVLVCRFIQGMSHRETAKIMETSEANVRVLQYRALRRLKQILNRQKE